MHNHIPVLGRHPTPLQSLVTRAFTQGVCNTWGTDQRIETVPCPEQFHRGYITNYRQAGYSLPVTIVTVEVPSADIRTSSVSFDSSKAHVVSHVLHHFVVGIEAGTSRDTDRTKGT